MSGSHWLFLAVSTYIHPVERRDFPHFFLGMQVLSLETQMADGDGMANFQGDVFSWFPFC